MKIQTKFLQNLLSKSIKGVGNNKLFVVTQYITIKATDKDITLLSTDGSNYLYVKENADLEDFNATVQADKFYQLINKMTVDEIELTFNNNILTIKGNGKYEIPTLNEEDVTEINNPFKDIQFNNVVSVDTKTLKKCIAIAKPSVALTFEQPQYIGYYFGDKVISTDSYQITSIDNNLFNTNILMKPTTAELLNLLSDDNVDVSINDNVILFKTDNITLYTDELSGKDDFNIDALSNFIDSTFENNITINKNQFTNALDRISLFVDAFDKNAIDISFTKDKLIITTKSSNAKEVIDYIDSDIKDDEYNIKIDIKLLQSQLNVIDNENISLDYHEERDRTIRFNNDNVMQVIALMTTDDDEE